MHKQSDLSESNCDIYELSMEGRNTWPIAVRFSDEVYSGAVDTLSDFSVTQFANEGFFVQYVYTCRMYLGCVLRYYALGHKGRAFNQILLLAIVSLERND